MVKYWNIKNSDISLFTVEKVTKVHKLVSLCVDIAFEEELDKKKRQFVQLADFVICDLGKHWTEEIKDEIRGYKT